MKRIRHELDSWAEGRAFMNRLADEYGGSVEERGENLEVHAEKFDASCHLDAREFAFITIKLTDEGVEPRIKALLDQFKANE